VVCTSACLCLGTKIDFLSFMNVDPQRSDSTFLLNVVDNPKVSYLGWKETFNGIHDLGIKLGKRSRKGKRLKFR
jgi:hypothetical protein